jgi:lysophospholipid acyltransferase (LPLAT)-like uncharacterized protein
MAKFKLRELFTRYPALDRLRTSFFAWWCSHGPTPFDRSYRRMRVVSPEARPFLVDDKKPVIFALYHGSMIALLGIHPRKNTTILISNSRDGEMIARACHEMGFSTARGSAGKGGVKGTLELLEAARQGQSIAFMVDGPRGPRQEVKVGIVRIAQMTGLPIIPIGLSGRTAFWPGSWDRFTATSWSAPMVTIFGEPLSVSESASDYEIEKARLLLEDRMKELERSADSLWAVSDGGRGSGILSV